MAVELVAAAQAVDFHRPLRSGRGVELALELIREEVDPLEEDRALAPDLERATTLVRDGRLAAVVERALEAGEEG